NLDHPVWVDDDSFDVDRHLHRIGLPPPGGRSELSEICGHIASLPLDRGRPLWEMWVIEGVADTDCHRDGRLAVMTKVHHCGVDGVTGANLMSQLAVGCGAPAGRCAWSTWCPRPCPRWSRRCARPSRARRWRVRSPRRGPLSTPASPVAATSRTPNWTSSTSRR